MKNVLMCLVILCVLAACRRVEYVYVNSCVPDICDEPETVEGYITGYYCKDKILQSCNKKPSE